MNAPCMRRNIVVSHFLIIASLSLIIYFNHFQNEFVYDDAVTIHRNFDIKHIKRTISNIANINTRPLVRISYAINYYISHLKPLGYHVTNFAFHLGTSFLIYWMVFHLSRERTYSLPFFSALLFSLHPLNTESVCYLSGRASIFLAFFYLLSICFFIRGKKLLKDNHFFLSVLFFLGTIFFFITGWLSKQNVATLPFVLIGINYFFYSAQDSESVFIKKNKAFLIFLGLLGLVAVYYGARNIPDPGAGKYSSLAYFATQFNAIPLYYLRLFLFPFNLNIDPDFPVFHSLGFTQITISVLTILFLIFFFIKIQKSSLNSFQKTYDEKKWMSFGLLWFFLTISPTSSFIPLNELVSEHRAYLPSAGLCIFFAALLLASMKKLKASFLKFSKHGFISGHSIILLIILFFCFNVVNRNFVWKNSERIWTDALKKSPLKARPYNEVGLIFFEQKELNKAEIFFKKTIELNPRYSHTIVNLGNLYSYQGRKEEAILKYQSAIELKRPDSYHAFIGLGNIHVKNNQLQAALDEYKKAVSLNPEHPLAIYNIGRIHELLNKTSDARTFYQKAVNIDPDFFLALNNLGVIYIHEGRYHEAVTLLKRALEVNQHYVEALGNLGVAYHLMGDVDLAKIYYQKALDNNPDYQLAKENLNKLMIKRDKSQISNYK